MPTPKTGAISMLDMRTEITRGTGAVSMSEVRTRAGFTGAISFSDVRNAEGALITQGSFTYKGATSNGYTYSGLYGSISPNDNNRMMQIAANSFLGQVVTGPAATATTITLFSSNTGVANGSAVTTGYKVTNVNYVAIGGTSRTVSNPISNTTVSYFTVSGTMAGSGTTDFFIRFA